MTTIYHGCVQEQDELAPVVGQFLYASKTKEEALLQGFVFEMESRFGILGFRCEGGEITLDLKDDRRPTWGEVKRINLQLYTIKFDPMDGWMKNSDSQHGLANEWKTARTISRNILSADRFPIGKLMLASKRFTFKCLGTNCTLTPPQ